MPCSCNLCRIQIPSASCLCNGSFLMGCIRPPAPRNFYSGASMRAASKQWPDTRLLPLALISQARESQCGFIPCVSVQIFSALSESSFSWAAVLLMTKIAPADPTPLSLAIIFGREIFMEILGSLAARSDLVANFAPLSEWLRRTSHLRPQQIYGLRFGLSLIP